MELPWEPSRWTRLAIILALGCATATPEPRVATQFTDADKIDESSVRPGINSPYFQPETLEKYARVLEAESREVVQYRDDIVAAIGLRQGMDVADIGAGTGIFISEIAKRVGVEGRLFAVDIAPAFLDRLRERVATEHLTNVAVVLGEERATGLAHNSIDLAFMCDTYHHIEYPRTYLASLFQTLRPGARLVLIDLERIEGKTSRSILEHVRADKETVIDEVSQAGFALESETDLLEENYYLHFRRPSE